MRGRVAARVPAVGQRFRGEVRKNSTAEWRSGSQKSLGAKVAPLRRANDDRIECAYVMTLYLQRFDSTQREHLEHDLATFNDRAIQRVR